MLLYFLYIFIMYVIIANVTIMNKYLSATHKGDHTLIIDMGL